jgi:hypothetical protein
MTAADVVAFTAAFNGLRVLFPLRADRAEVEQLQRLYFRALARFSIERVEAGAETWTASGTRFPKPAEWVRAIPSEDRALSRLHVLDEPEATEHRRAAARYYEGEPCACFDCQQAGVTHRLLRYVPMQDEHGCEMRGLLDGRPVVRGYWAHGADLAAFYEARDAFTAEEDAWKGRKSRWFGGREATRWTTANAAPSAASR